MNITATHIAHLISHKRILAVGGLGVFERLCIPASYDSINHIITPPSVRIVFERSFVENSSPELLESLRRERSLCIGEAEAQIRTDAASIESMLYSHGRYQFGSAFTMTYNASTGVVKCQQNDTFVDKNAYSWLAPILMQPLESSEQTTETKSTTKTNIPEEIHRNIFSRTVRIAASSAAVIAVFAIVAFVTTFANRLGNEIGIPTTASISTTTQPVVATPTLQTPTNEAPLVLVFRTPADAVDDTPATIRPTTRTAVSTSTPTTGTGRYCLIVASLANRAEAEQFISQHSTNDITLNLLESQGRFRVYAMEGIDAAGLTSEARASGLYDIYPQAWVCRR